ncbi:RNA polymerase sigma factor [Dyadobacter sp. MSC1_007]|jgi:DNA-directed RNA polymerase specialized sigma24 family protein|uniref:RNA polymerase sigma factor n=1 Tax=Dyadobacter sp. MSC1_007 TaxID=2909264 RepID=UPI00202EFF3C|nr:sigma factor [Dyadobacter sp. MSC1_007]
MKELTVNDHFLAINIQKGDMACLAKIYETYHAYLFQLALRFLKSSEHAEEVVHDVFLKFWENRESLNEEFSLKGCLTKICKSHILQTLTRAVSSDTPALQVRH